MDIKAKLTQKAIQQDWVEINILSKDVDKVLCVIDAIIKKAKLDRYEQSIIEELVAALESVPNEKIPLPEDFPKSTPVAYVQKGSEVHNKMEIVAQLQKQIEPNSDVSTFMNNSVRFAQEKMGIKTAPKDDGIPAFYDWMVEVGVINADGTPKGK